MFTQSNPSVSPDPNATFKVIAIAASRGGLKAISEILSALPPDFLAAIVVVQHLSAQHPSYLSEILSQRTSLRVKQAEVGERLCQGTVYIAAPDKHLLVNLDRTLSFSDAAKVNFVRPAADKLFASVAASYQSQAIALVLTGGDGDGSAGVIAIKKYGGTVIVQDEATSENFSMPKSAIATNQVDLILPLDAIAAALINLVTPDRSGMSRKAIATG